MGVKLDISKAYDRVEWDFLERVMQKMGFNADWVHLVMSCVTTVNFTVVINGQSGDAFSPSHGIRQGKYLGSHFLGQSKERSTFVHEISNSSEGTRLESTLPFRSWP
ncbi:unnamed protein product [Prunus armeniaca]